MSPSNYEVVFEEVAAWLWTNNKNSNCPQHFTFVDLEVLTKMHYFLLSLIGSMTIQTGKCVAKNDNQQSYKLCPEELTLFSTFQPQPIQAMLLFYYYFTDPFQYFLVS